MLSDITETDYLVSLEGITDRVAFFTELLSFYAPKEVNLTLWGKLPPTIKARLAPFCAPCSWLRHRIFNESAWHLNPKSLNALIQNLCEDDILSSITWAVSRSMICLGLCRSWDDMHLVGSERIDETELFEWLGHLKSKGLLRDYEKIID